MHITVKLFATLRQGRFEQKTMECAAGIRIDDIISLLEIPPPEAAIVFRNNRHADGHMELQEGDTLAIFPPVGGG